MSKIIKGTNDFVEVTLSGVDLTSFTKVEATLGGDTRDSVADPASVIVISSSVLRLAFGDTTETGGHYWHIVGFNLSAPLGITLTSRCLGNLSPVTIC
jgi:hypothetical protein